MKLKVDRIDETTNSTLGNFYINNVRQCYTLENDYDPIKVQGETRIPKGVYQVTLRYFGGFYDKYSAKFNEDHPTLEIKDVPNYEHILIHIGNYYKDTAGCILVGELFRMGAVTGNYSLINSTKAYKKIYYPIQKALLAGEKVTIEIGDTVSNKKPEKTIPAKKVEPVETIPAKTDIPWYHFYRKNGFKRIAGLTVGAGALILKSAAPELGVVLDVVLATGIGTLGIGGADALKKNREKDGETYVDKNKYLRFFADILIKLIKQYFKSKGKSK